MEGREMTELTENLWLAGGLGFIWGVAWVELMHWVLS
jgi:hypothetical protein